MQKDEVSQARLMKLREDIPEYQNIQKKLMDYLILESDKTMNIHQETLMLSINYVFSKVQEKSRPDKNVDRNKIVKLEHEFFKLYQAEITQICHILVKNLMPFLAGDSQLYIVEIEKQIHNFKTYMLTVYKIFQHLNSLYLNNNRTSLFVEGAKLFKKQYIDQISRDLNVRLFEQLRKYKEGITINVGAVAFVIEHIGLCGFEEIKGGIELEKPNKYANPIFVLNNISPYETNYFRQKFTVPWTEFITQQYKEKSKELLQLSTPEYVEEALRYLKLEQDIAMKFYNSASPRKIFIMTTENILATENGRAIMDNETSGLMRMLENRKDKEISRIYQLIKRSDHMNYLCSILSKYIERQGSAIFDKITAEDQKQLKKQKISETIQALLQLKNIVDELVSGPFQNDLKIQQCRDHAFQSVINRTPRPTNFLCHYADMEFRKSKNNPEECTLMIGNVMKIYKYLYSPDNFLKLYQKLLTLRILNEQFKSRESELELITKLKAESGASALTKISTMISDVDISERFYNDNIKNNLAFNRNFSFTVQFLTTGSWPITDHKSEKNLVPEQLKSTVRNFEHIYNQKFPGKVLNWIFMYGNAELEAKFGSKNHALKVSGFQILVLLRFQDPHIKQQTVLDIQSAINAKQETNLVNSAINQLVKLKILLKDGEQGKLQPQNVLVFNEQFTYKTRKVVCIQAQKYVQKPSQQMTEEVMKEREVIIDCIIVRVMKSRKLARYDQIIGESTKLCKTFKCQTGMIKRRLQTLIQMQYLKRDDKDSNILIYIPS